MDIQHVAVHTGRTAVEELGTAADQPDRFQDEAGSMAVDNPVDTTGRAADIDLAGTVADTVGTTDYVRSSSLLSQRISLCQSDSTR